MLVINGHISHISTAFEDFSTIKKLLILDLLLLNHLIWLFLFSEGDGI